MSFMETTAGLSLKVEDLHLDNSVEEARMRQDLLAALQKDEDRLEGLLSTMPQPPTPQLMSTPEKP